MAYDTQNWTTIKQRAAEDSHWPGQRAYCLCPIWTVRELCPKNWLDELHEEARRHGCWVDFHERHVYIVVPKPVTKVQKEVLRFLSERARYGNEWSLVADAAYRRSLKVLVVKGLVEVEGSALDHNLRARLAPFKPLPTTNQV